MSAAKIVDQPPPVQNDRASIQDLVIADMEERKRIGMQRYGTLLKPHNGRDALVDLYQEILNAAQYVRQEIEERNDHAAAEREKVVEYLDRVGFHGLAQDIRDCRHHDTIPAPPSEDMEPERLEFDDDLSAPTATEAP